MATLESHPEPIWFARLIPEMPANFAPTSPVAESVYPPYSSDHASEIGAGGSEHPARCERRASSTLG